jgi:hypothetical protein
MENELKELFKALGYCGGEITEITKDGVGLEDLKSVKEIIDNKEMLLKGFKVDGAINAESLKEIGLDGLVAIIMEAKEGYALGLK